MSEGFNDPNNGLPWATGQLITSYQMSTLADNQRALRLHPWFDLQVVSTGVASFGLVHGYLVQAESTHEDLRPVWLSWDGNAYNVDDISLRSSVLPETSLFAHGQAITVSARNYTFGALGFSVPFAGDPYIRGTVVLSLFRTANTTTKYLLLRPDGAGGWETGVSTHAGDSSTAACTGMASGDGQVVATWANGNVDALNAAAMRMAQISDRSAGSIPYKGVVFGGGRFIVYLANTIYSQASGSLYTAWTGLATPGYNHDFLTYDEVHGIWYTVESDTTLGQTTLSIGTTTDPTQSFFGLPNTTVPFKITANNSGSDRVIKGFVVHAGVMAMLTTRTLYLSKDSGQTWTGLAVSANLNHLSIQAGRLLIKQAGILSVSEVVVSAPFAEIEKVA